MRKLLNWRILPLLALGLWLLVTLQLATSVDAALVTLEFRSVKAVLWLASGGFIAILVVIVIAQWPTQAQKIGRTQLQLASYRTDGLILCNAAGRVQWHNRAAEAVMKEATLPDELQSQLKESKTKRQLSWKIIPLNGRRYSVQIIPLAKTEFAIILHPVKDNTTQNSLYDNFIRRIVHDMRNPLAGIIGHATNLRFVDNPGNAQQAAATIEKEAQRLSRLVDSMLFDARLAYVPLNIEHFDLLDVIEEAVYAVEDAVYHQGKTIQVLAPPEHLPFSGDRDLLLRALGNLIDNAVKYTADDGIIHIKVDAQPDLYHLTVQDNGIGIPADYLPDRIFQPLVRVRNNGDGSGLGLSIVHKIVTVHHGTIQVQSNEDGTTMLIRLPRTVQ